MKPQKKTNRENTAATFAIPARKTPKTVIAMKPKDGVMKETRFALVGYDQSALSGNTTINFIIFNM